MHTDKEGGRYFKLHPSNICLIFLLSAYALVLLIVFTLPIVSYAKIALAVLLVFSLVYYLRRDALLLLPASQVAIRLDGDHVVLSSLSGKQLSGQILRNSVVTPALTILNILPQGKHRSRSVVIFPDSMDKERFRELRVLLKWGS